MLAALATSLPALIGGDPPAEIVVLPPGPLVAARDGRQWTLDSPEEVARRSTLALGGQQAVIDYEHASLTAMNGGHAAPAAGWISEFRARPDGAVAAVVSRWTERAAEMLRAGEYRYVSPVFEYEKSGGTIKRVVSVGLTNTPALPDLPAVARRRFDERKFMTLDGILAKLDLGEDADEAAVDAALAKRRAEALAPVAKAAGLPEDANGAQVEKAVAALRAQPDPAQAAVDAALAKRRAEALASVAKAVGLPEDANGAQVEKAVAALRAQPDPAQWVPRAEFDGVAARLATVETETQTAAATAQVDAAIKAGQVAPASRGWALDYCRSDPAGFAKFVESAPAILAPGELPRPHADGKRALTADEQAVCRATGVAEADYLAQVAA